MIRLVDGHTHLEEIESFEKAITRAGEAGVFAIIAVGSDCKSNERTLEISGRYGDTVVYPALGIHPWTLKAKEVERTVALIEENIGKAVGVGEIRTRGGRDHHEQRSQPLSVGSHRVTDAMRYSSRAALFPFFLFLLQLAWRVLLFMLFKIFVRPVRIQINCYMVPKLHS
ncbi:MAG: TatD family hydrolase [Desulfobacteraceae bacterium]